MASGIPVHVSFHLTSLPLAAICFLPLSGNDPVIRRHTWKRLDSKRITDAPTKSPEAKMISNESLLTSKKYQIWSYRTSPQSFRLLPLDLKTPKGEQECLTNLTFLRNADQS